MIYGYARCSTNEDLQDINRQIRELKQQGATDTTIYKEYESGTKVNRAELQKLLNVIQTGDTIVATEVSRLPVAPNSFVKFWNWQRKRKSNWFLAHLW